MQINKNGSVSLSYGADLSRVKQVRNTGGTTTTTYYIDKHYEVEKTGSGNTTQVAYISDVAIIKLSDADKTIRFTHRDRLGSATTLTDHNGQVTARRHFDAFGAPRGGDWSELGLVRLPDSETRRGFTGHEHLDEAELIHMNGRVYDYKVGRFLSVDPIIQSPGNSQSINPYSYIMNNPLAGTDPSGYVACDANGKNCDIGSEKLENVESIQIDKKGNITVNTKDGNSYAVESHKMTSNGMQAVSSNQISSISTANVDRMSQKENAIQSVLGADSEASTNPTFNGTETASTVVGTPFGPLPIGPKSPEQIANDEAAAMALQKGVKKLVQTIRGATEEDNVEQGIVIGETQDRVEFAAEVMRKQGFNVETIKPVWPWGNGNFEPSEGMEFNRRWINQKMDEGYTIYDIGLDKTRYGRSKYYRLEREEIRRREYEKHVPMRIKGVN